MRLQIAYVDHILPIIAGDTGAAKQQVTISDPWGNWQWSWSGNKPEHGPGGFEFNAEPGNPYVIRVSGETWQFEHRRGMTFLTWTATPEPEPPEPEPPEPEPEPPEPEPPEPEPPSDRFLVTPGIVYSARLQNDIILWQEGQADDAAYWFVGQHLPGAELWLPYREALTAETLVNWIADLRLRVERLERVIT